MRWNNPEAHTQATTDFGVLMYGVLVVTMIALALWLLKQIDSL